MKLGILGPKSNVLIAGLLFLFITNSCKIKTDIVEQSTTEMKTNIRFATKSDHYQEKTKGVRLQSAESAITSTHFQMEGPAWENENVAFRNYFDGRNGMDIFGKRKKGIELDLVGIDENYHELQDWGMDILSVGNSLGAGAIALLIGENLYRIGPNSTGTFSIVEESSSSSTLEFAFKDWVVEGRTYHVYHTITIKQNTHYYSSSVRVEGLQGDEALVTGIVKHVKDVEVYEVNGKSVMATFGKQDMLGNGLGMAISFDSDQLYKMGMASSYKGDIDNTYVLALEFDHSTAGFNFFTGWELSEKRFGNKEGFNNMVKGELQQ